MAYDIHDTSVESELEPISSPTFSSFFPAFSSMESEQSTEQKQDESTGDSTGEQSNTQTETETGNNQGTGEASENADVTAQVQSELPDYITEAWRPPTDADDSWYKQKYTEALSYPNSPEFQEKFLSNIKENIIAAQEDADKIIEVSRMLLSGNTRALRQYFPEKLQEIGVEPVLTQEEIGTLIQNQLAQEFGENYEQLFDNKQLLNPMSQTAQMHNRSQQLLAHFANLNAERKTNFEKYKAGVTEQPVTQSEVKYASKDEMYDVVKDTMNKDEFEEVFKYAEENAPKWTIADARKVMKYDDDVKAAYERGKAEALGYVKSAGNAKPTSNNPPQKVKNEERTPTWEEYMANLQR